MRHSLNTCKIHSLIILLLPFSLIKTTTASSNLVLIPKEMGPAITYAQEAATGPGIKENSRKHGGQDAAILTSSMVPKSFQTIPAMTSVQEDATGLGIKARLKKHRCQDASLTELEAVGSTGKFSSRGLFTV